MMKCLPNCGKCCVEVNIPKEVIEKNRHLIQDNPKCVCRFLSKDKKCLIYEDRPLVCRNFGEKPNVPCLLLTKVKPHSVQMNNQVQAERMVIFK